MQMKIAGITGGIGSGKSTVSALMEMMGVPVYNADTESKKLTDTSPEIRKKLTERFGAALFSDGKLNKALLASLIFNHAENLQYVNSVIHPVVRTDFSNWMERHRRHKLVSIETAILFESGFDSTVDIKVNVSAPLDIRIQRIKARDKQPIETILSRIKSQISDEEKNKLVDYIIYNDGKAALIPQVEQFISLNL
ncbi:dephospho-CoA kinase [Bacteroidia bacterium]|nr:dephospho-CoA kinase [Bacteroidia bacterium]